MKFNTIKKAVLSVFMVLFVSVSVLAQEKQDKNVEGAKKVTASMKEQLTLNNGQNTKVYVLNLDFLKKVAENNKKTNKVEKMKKQRALEEERDTKLKSVLSADQYSLYIATKAQDRKRIAEFYQ